MSANEENQLPIRVMIAWGYRIVCEGLAARLSEEGRPPRMRRRASSRSRRWSGRIRSCGRSGSRRAGGPRA